jgi:chemotaxis protein histidine kinase CheA
MAITQTTYTGDGSTTNYSFTFEYLKQADVKVTLDTVATTAFTFANATTLAFTTAPGNGVAIRIFRDTAIDTLSSTFFPGSAIKAEDLNQNFTQNLYVTQESDFEVDTANTTANTAKTTADTALTTSNTALTTANAATVTANTADTNASAAVTTANTASSNATAAVTTANTASTNATAAVNTANTASTNASAAVVTANSAATDASTALTTANSATTTANTALTNSSTALTTATTADTNASAAVTTANTANTNATAAVATANAAQSAVAGAAFYSPVANVASIPGSPSNNDRVEVADSTGIQSFTPLTGYPVGFIGSSGLTARIQYSSSGSTWNWVDYFANDPENRYFTKTSGNTNTTNIATNTSNISTNTANITTNTSNIATNVTNIAANVTSLATKLPLAGGTMTGFITLNAAPTANLHAASKQYVDDNKVIAIDAGNFDNGTSTISSTLTIDGGSF